MDNTDLPAQPQGRRRETLLSSISASFSRTAALAGLQLLLLGGISGYFLLHPPASPAAALAARGEDPQIPISGPTATPTPSPTLYRHQARSDAPHSPTPSPTVYRYQVRSIPTRTSTPTPKATEAPDPSPTSVLPAQARIEGISGHRQSMPLSCESRSAVDWAAYFGFTIDEYAFQNGLPLHDNPEKGFVGDVYGSWGQIPPFPYGVHAKPIAQRLREYGLNAKAVREMTWQELQAELAAGRPVIVWVVGHVARGTPVPYTASGGAVTTVAAFEHTVIVIGYTEDKVTLLDGARVYSRYQGEFMKSWGVLENQAVIWID